MKRYLFLLSLIFSNLVFAEKPLIICGKFKSSQPLVLKMYEPIKGYFNPFFIERNNSKLAVYKDSFFYKTDLESPAYFKLYFTYALDNKFAGVVNILAIPGDSVHTVFDLGKKGEEWVRYSGSNAEGNSLFEKINTNPFNKFIPFHNLLKTLPEKQKDFINGVERLVTDAIDPFTILYDNNKISKAYYENVSKSLRIGFYYEVTRRIIGNLKSNQNIDKSWRDSVASYFFEKEPLTNDLKGLYNSISYFNGKYIYNVYKKKNYQYLEQFEKENIYYNVNDSLIEIDKILAFLPEIQDRERQEELWAFYLTDVFRFMPGYFKSSILDQYKFLFPNSYFYPFLKDAFDKSTPKNAISYTTLFPIYLLDSVGSTKSIQQIVNESSSGKRAYIDLWATWFGPCISEFAHNSQIDSFLMKEKINRIYISLDNVGNDKAWKSSISKYKLGGRHVLAGEELKHDIRKLFSLKKDDPIAIPRYIFIDEKGKIFLDAPYPSDGDFQKQIKNFLK